MVDGRGGEPPSHVPRKLNNARKDYQIEDEIESSFKLQNEQQVLNTK
jgi:hypothetical protein